jgi:hypothetical protein
MNGSKGMAGPEVSPTSRRRWLKPVWDLVVEVWVGSLLFAVLFAPAVLLDLGINYLKESYELSGFLVGLLTGTKYVIGTVDAILYVVFMINMGWLFLKRLQWNGVDHE